MKNSTATLLLILGVGLSFFYAYPSYKDLIKLIDEKEVFAVALNDARELKDLQNSLYDKYKSLNPSDLENLKKVVPEYFDGESLSSVISNISSTYGMQLYGFSVVPDTGRVSDGEAVSSKGYKTKEVSFVLKGNYTSFVKVLQDLEKSLLLMDLKKISIKRDERSSAPNVLSFEVVFNTYSIK